MGNLKRFAILASASVLFGTSPVKASWYISFWNGSMLDSDLNNTLTFKGRTRPETVTGLGIGKKLLSKGHFDLSGEVNVLHHNVLEPYYGKSFIEGVTGLKLTYLTSLANFSIIEGVSYNTSSSDYEKRTKYGNGKSSQLLNYLALEVEVPMDKQYSLLGRIHHRSGIYGFFDGVSGGSNAYLLGLKYKIL